VALSDGNTSTDMNPQHTYVFHGNLTVNLSALNNLSITGSLSGEL
jgi:PKD repeat protein